MAIFSLNPLRQLKRRGINVFHTVAYYLSVKKGLSEYPMESVQRVIFVCYGNICRSAFAEAYAKKMNAQYQTNVQFESSGLFAKNGKKSPEDAVRAANALGIDLSHHRAKLLDPVSITGGDLLVGMDYSHFSLMRRRIPGKKGIFLLKQFAPQPILNINIEDPYGKSYSRFLECFEEINMLVECILKRLGKKNSV